MVTATDEMAEDVKTARFLLGTQKKGNSQKNTAMMEQDIHIEDEEQRENLPTIGYFAMFEYHNGFKKVLYWSRSKMEQHALKYSQGYRAKK